MSGRQSAFSLGYSDGKSGHSHKPPPGVALLSARVEYNSGYDAGAEWRRKHGFADSESVCLADIKAHWANKSDDAHANLMDRLMESGFAKDVDQPLADMVSGYFMAETDALEWYFDQTIREFLGME